MFEILEKEKLLILSEKYREEILLSWETLTDNKQPFGRKYSTTSPIDLLLMLLYILETSPANSIEFSPFIGYSSSVIATGMKFLGRKNCFVTFEKDKRLIKYIDERVKKYDLDDYMKVEWGEAISNIKSFLNINKDWNVQFVFSDCCHRKEFSRRYTKEIFPLLSKDCTIFIHDVSSNKDGGFSTNSPKPADEHIGVKEWVDKVNPQYMLTHKAFGGQVERSVPLPVDKRFFDSLEKILGRDILEHEKSAPACFISNNPGGK